MDLDIQCGGCGYSLRGLRGPMPICPECGEVCDIPALLAGQRADWIQNDEYVMLARPSILVQLAIVPAMLVLPALAFSGAWIVSGVIAAAVLGWWAYLAGDTLRRAPGWETVSIMAGLHVVFVGYLATIVLTVGGLVALLVSVTEFAVGASLSAGVFTLGLVCAPAIALMSPIHRLDRMLGRRCVCRWLQRLRQPGLTASA